MSPSQGMLSLCPLEDPQALSTQQPTSGCQVTEIPAIWTQGLLASLPCCRLYS